MLKAPLLVFSMYVHADGTKQQFYSLKKCEQVWAHNNTIPFDEKGNFLAECAPDTLYSWRSREEVLSRANDGLHSKCFLEIKKPIFTWRTPIGTFGYGSFDGISMRIKLKNNVRFLFRRNGVDCSGEQLNSVNVSYNSDVSYSEYVICSPSIISSWSFAREEHLREMLLEKEWVSTHAVGDYDQYVRPNNLEVYFDEMKTMGFNIDRSALFFNFAIDLRPTDQIGLAWSKSTLDQKLTNMTTFIQQGMGQVFFNDDIPNDEKIHFHSKSPSYFSPITQIKPH